MAHANLTAFAVVLALSSLKRDVRWGSAICFPTKETAIFTVEFLKIIRINSCGFDGDSANALIELQSSKNITGAKVCKDRRMTLRLIIITSFLYPFGNLA